MTNHRDRRRRVPLSIAAASALAMTIAACATVDVKNTPMQAVALDRWQVCRERASGAQLDHIERDGRIHFWYTAGSDRVKILECLTGAAQNRSDLPEPIALLKPGRT
jgi:hypothetical protein